MSIFPFIDTDPLQEDKEKEELPLLKEYAYDFKENRLLLNEKGCTYLVNGNEALKIWIYKALYTPRFRFTAYSTDFGNEMEENLIGKPVSQDIAESELQRYIIEALMVNPYIKELRNFTFKRKQSGMWIAFECTSIYGIQKISAEWKMGISDGI